MKPAERGFTLLEIVIALAVAALGIAAVAKATGGAATVAAETRERMLAVWVAGNRLSELRIARAWPSPGAYEEVRTMGGRTWYLTETVTPTGIDAVRRVDIEVYTDFRRDEREFEVYGYVARYREPDEAQETGDTNPQDDEAQTATAEEGGTPLPGEQDGGDDDQDLDGQENAQPLQDNGTGSAQ